VSGAARVRALAWPTSELRARLVDQDVVVCSAGLHADEGAVRHAAALLSPSERQRFEGYTNDVVARRFAVGRGTLRTVVGAALGIAPAAVRLVEGLHGKPVLAHGASPRPLWFSVAHCEELLLVALSRRCDVGVDVERVRAFEQWERVADRVLDAAEREQLRRAVEWGEDPGTAFLRHWCRVEAELKAIGCGIAGLEAHRAGKRPLGLRVVDLADVPVPGEVLASGARYQAAVAMCAPGVGGARQSMGAVVATTTEVRG
jgi:4'-phosphopantetheinyl transferase